MFFFLSRKEQKCEKVCIPKNPQVDAKPIKQEVCLQDCTEVQKEVPFIQDDLHCVDVCSRRNITKFKQVEQCTPKTERTCKLVPKKLSTVELDTLVDDFGHILDSIKPIYHKVNLFPHHIHTYNTIYNCHELIIIFLFSRCLILKWHVSTSQRSLAKPILYLTLLKSRIATRW